MDADGASSGILQGTSSPPGFRNVAAVMREEMFKDFSLSAGAFDDPHGGEQVGHGRQEGWRDEDSWAADGGVRATGGSNQQLTCQLSF